MSPTPHLTEAIIRAIKPPQAGRTDRPDGRVPGLALRIYAGGQMVWTYRYTALGSGRKRRFVIGDWPAVSLLAARGEAGDLRSRIRHGEDPEADRAKIANERRKREAAPTLAELLPAYLAELARRKSSWRDDERFLRKELLGTLGEDTPVSEIAKSALANLISQKARLAPVSANRLRAAMSVFFNWCVAAGHLDTSPLIGIKKPHRERRHDVDRVLTDDELIVLLKAVEAHPGLSAPVKGALRVLAHTGKRPAEISGLRIDELRHLDDPTRAVAEIEPGRMKNRRRHVLPLTVPVLKVVCDQIARLEERSREEGREIGSHVFVSRYSVRDGLARHSLSRALARVIAGMEAQGDRAHIVRKLKADPPAPKAFRATVATGLARLGINREDRRAVLAHVEDDVLGQHSTPGTGCPRSVGHSRCGLSTSTACLAARRRPATSSQSGTPSEAAPPRPCRCGRVARR